MKLKGVPSKTKEKGKLELVFDESSNSLFPKILESWAISIFDRTDRQIKLFYIQIVFSSVETLLNLIH